ncbi:hypothetical protein FIBSPDRAFT_695017, partial [Athelia psychrophila]
NTEDMYAAPDSFICRDHAKLHIANFSSSNITIRPGQILGTARNPRAWLDRKERYTEEEQQRMEAQAAMIRKIADIRDPKTLTVQSEAKEVFGDTPSWFLEEDALAEPPVEGGPKAAEVEEDYVDSANILKELDINPELPPEKRKQIEQAILKNQLAFGLDGRLGHLDARVQIPMKPGAKEVSLPPFPTSPAKREVM